MFSINAYDLLKIIEIIIRVEENLSRDLIRHMNTIETKILESFAWKSNSPIWSLLKNESVPTYDEV